LARGVGPHQWRTDHDDTEGSFVGIDVAKRRNAVAIADAGRDGEIRYMGGEHDAIDQEAGYET
jgi:hypothetical protein